MIDFHAHILPNVDDGSQSLEETFNLINEAKEAGFEAIISTSHYMEGYYEVQNEEKSTWINELNKKLQEQKINIELYIGNEIYLTENIIKLLEEDKASTINNTSYVLFELPLNAKPIDLEKLVFKMTSNKLVPVLAHAERYLFIQKDPNIIKQLIELGVLIQCNFASFIGMYGSKAEIIAKKLLKNNMIHFLGSDVHKQNSIYKKMPEIIKKLENLVGKEKLQELTQINPMLVLKNKRIEISEPTEIKISFIDLFKTKFEN